MNKLNINAEIYLILLVVIILLTGLTGFIIYFLVLYRKKQVLNLIEQERLAVEFQQEILKTQYEVQEQTMQTIGADLHDNIGQLLSLTSLTLNSIELDNKVKAREKVDAAIDLTVRSIKEMRLLGKLLQGDQLVVSGLSEAIRHEINWMERSGKYKIKYTRAEDLPASNNPDKDLILFRILQEILNNIIKHANASRIYINLEYNEGTLQLQITDNGIGFNADELTEEQRGMGLQNIRKRAGIIGGEVAIKSNPGEGAQITIFIPYP